MYVHETSMGPNYVILSYSELVLFWHIERNVAVYTLDEFLDTLFILKM